MYGRQHKVAEVACYRTERPFIGAADSVTESANPRLPVSVFEFTKQQSGWGEKSHSYICLRNTYPCHRVSGTARVYAHESGIQSLYTLLFFDGRHLCIFLDLHRSHIWQHFQLVSSSFGWMQQ